jgi:hypothetical protein
MWLEEFNTLGVAFRNSLWIWLNSFLMNSTEWLKALKCLGLWSPAMDCARFSNNCQDACGDYCSQAYFEHTWIGSEWALDVWTLVQRFFFERFFAQKRYKFFWENIWQYIGWNHWMKSLNCYQIQGGICWSKPINKAYKHQTYKNIWGSGFTLTLNKAGTFLK